MEYKQNYTQSEFERAYNDMKNTCVDLAKKGWKEIGLLDKDIEILLSRNKVNSKIIKVKAKKVIKSCKNCANNVEFPPPHTCDECDVIGRPDFYMWEPIFPVCKKG